MYCRRRACQGRRRCCVMAVAPSRDRASPVQTGASGMCCGRSWHCTTLFSLTLPASSLGTMPCTVLLRVVAGLSLFQFVWYLVEPVLSLLLSAGQAAVDRSSWLLRPTTEPQENPSILHAAILNITSDATRVADLLTEYLLVGEIADPDAWRDGFVAFLQVRARVCCVLAGCCWGFVVMLSTSCILTCNTDLAFCVLLSFGFASDR
jgi:hypothetical protein